MSQSQSDSAYHSRHGKTNLLSRALGLSRAVAELTIIYRLRTLFAKLRPFTYALVRSLRQGERHQAFCDVVFAIRVPGTI